MKVTINHCPRQCRQALARASSAVLDLETSGLDRFDCIVSAGLLVDRTAYILFVRSMSTGINNLQLDEFRKALEPLGRPDMTLILHNATFDLGFLRREGIEVNARIHDTLKMLRLLDQDRGSWADDRTEVRQPRRDLRAQRGAERQLNYRLKDVVRQLLAIEMREFPGSLRYADYETHRIYLASDLLGTRKLHKQLTAWMLPGLRDYHERLVAPLTPFLVEMSHLGAEADPDFIHAESDRLLGWTRHLSAAHAARFGRLLGMSRAELIQWLYTKRGLNLPVLKWNLTDGSWTPSLAHGALDCLMDYAKRMHLERPVASLALIHDYRLASSLLKRLRPLLKHIGREGRIHSGFNDIQASGRISSTYPNLQQVANKVGPDERKKFISELAAKIEVRSRNALVAGAGHVLVSYDCKQADVRVLADRVASFLFSTTEHRRLLVLDRLQKVPEIRQYLGYLQTCLNLNYKGDPPKPPPEFRPGQPNGILEAFTTPGEFYAKAVERILGRPPKDTTERNFFKPVILGVINGQTAKGLARMLKVTEKEAKGYLKKYEAAYPKEIAYKWLQYQQIALTGQTTTFMGRTRTCTAHRWMVNEPLVRLFVHYKRGDSYWVECIPLQAGLRVLTAYNLRVINAKNNRLIYDHQRGSLVAERSRYRLFASEKELVYLLPVRNWAWRNIRRVQARGEEATYEGFDATARSLFNSICQGGTADLVKLMMLRTPDVCRRFEAKLLLQIHDELVFEVPTEQAASFIPAMQEVLEQQPCPGFKTPIKVGVKSGRAFGDMK